MKHDSDMSIRAQQLAQVVGFDLTVSLPASPGSIAELHDLASVDGVSHKIVVFLDSRHREGYSQRSLTGASSNFTPRLVYYEEGKFPKCVFDEVVHLLRGIQEHAYMTRRRGVR